MGAVGMLAGGAALLVVDATAALPLVVLVPVLFGLPQGLNSVTNQLTVYRQAPEGGLGTATGLSRTAQYVGAMLATGLLALAYGEQATDGGLAVVGAVCAAVAVGLLVLTATDRALRRG